jgi:two-component system chemotaxis response regulator CheY
MGEEKNEGWGGVVLKRILIVDDAAFVRVVLKKTLEKMGYEVVGEAEDGESALQKYKELRPDCVTLDIIMPVMDGMEILKELLEIDPQVKVIMISAMGNDHHINEAMKNGAAYFVVKPVKEELLAEALLKTIGV